MTATVNLVAFLALVVTLLLVWRQSWPARLRLFAAQSVLLAGLALALALFTGRTGLLMMAGVILVVKAWAIPRVLGRIAVGGPRRPPAPGRSAGLSLLAAGSLVVIAYVIMLPVTSLARLPTTGAIPFTFATALIGLYACVIARDAFGQILGFLMFENGLFGLALLVTYGLPGLVEAGVLLDLLVAVLIMEGVVVQIRREHDSIEVDRLRELRG